MTSSPPRVLIVQKFPFLPTIRLAQAARAQGFEPIIITSPSSPIDVATREAIDCVTIDDWSLGNLRSVVETLSAGHSIAGLMTGAGLFTGQGLLGAFVAELARERSLPHCSVEGLWRANNKFLMRSALDAAGLANARFARIIDADSIDAACDTVGFPMILKPVTGIGSSFIYRCRTVDDVRAAYAHFRENASRGYYSHVFEDHTVEYDGQAVSFRPMSELLAEEYLPGVEFSVECVCIKGDAKPLMIHDKVDVDEGTFCVYENLSITPPIRLDSFQQRAAMEYAAQAVEALGLQNTFCHVELRLNARGAPTVMEINPRIGGASIIDSLAEMRGIAYADVYVALSVGEDVTLPDFAPSAADSYAGVMTIFPRTSGRVVAISGVEDARQLCGVRLLRQGCAVGDLVGGDFEEVFVVDAFIRAETPADVVRVDRAVRDLVQITIAV